MPEAGNRKCPLLAGRLCRRRYYLGVDVGTFIERHDYSLFLVGSAVGGEAFVVLAGFAAHSG